MRLGSLTAIYYSLTYIGFAVPVLLASASHLAGYPTLLLVGAGLSAMTLLAVRRGARSASREAQTRG